MSIHPRGDVAADPFPPVVTPVWEVPAVRRAVAVAVVAAMVAMAGFAGGVASNWLRPAPTIIRIAVPAAPPRGWVSYPSGDGGQIMCSSASARDAHCWYVRQTR